MQKQRWQSSNRCYKKQKVSPRELANTRVQAQYIREVAELTTVLRHLLLQASLSSSKCYGTLETSSRTT